MLRLYSVFAWFQRMVVLVFLVPTASLALEPPKLAISGYDPVAYFTEGGPTVGKAAFSHVWDGLRYQFASAANRDRFAAEPDRYAPNYNGYCAATLARGNERRPADPRHWIIIEGKLYLFAGARGVEAFAKNHGLVRKSDANWVATKKSLN